ncbi:MAG TPA: HEAT repeat domain-containing protein [Anaeromyxobacter sp.]|nr:HEAT repeat domain-containing protein [Anaeromyxobacter sp.]
MPRWQARYALAVLAAAVLAAAARADPQADRALRALESSSSLKVRSQAALVLGQLRAREALPALRRAASSDPASAVRIAAVAALARLGGAEARAALEAVQRGDGDAGVRAAASGALSDLASAPPTLRPNTAVSLEDAVGTGGGPADRLALRDALGRRLSEAGFQVQQSGGLRLKPSIVRLDVERGGDRTVVAVRAELVAVEGGGRMAAMLEGGARLSARGTLGERELAAVSVRAVDEVAKILVDDLAAKLGER